MHSNKNKDKTLLTKCTMHVNRPLLLPKPTRPPHRSFNPLRPRRPCVPCRNAKVRAFRDSSAPRQLARAINDRRVPRRQPFRRIGPAPDIQTLRDLTVRRLPPLPPQPLDHDISPGEEEEGAEEELGPDGEPAVGGFADEEGVVDGGVGGEGDDEGDEGGIEEEGGREAHAVVEEVEGGKEEGGCRGSEDFGYPHCLEQRRSGELGFRGRRRRKEVMALA